MKRAACIANGCPGCSTCEQEDALDAAHREGYRQGCVDSSPLVWSKGPPPSAGWYWWRDAGTTSPISVGEVVIDEGEWWVDGVFPAPKGLEIAGPIPMPAEPQEPMP